MFPDSVPFPGDLLYSVCPAIKLAGVVDFPCPGDFFDGRQVARGDHGLIPDFP